jgi:hypothetical protein
VERCGYCHGRNVGILSVREEIRARYIEKADDIELEYKQTGLKGKETIEVYDACYWI